MDLVNSKSIKSKLLEVTAGGKVYVGLPVAIISLLKKWIFTS